MKRHTIKKYPFYYALPMVLSECFYPYLYRNFIFVTETGMDRFKKRARMFTCIPNGVSEELLKIEPKEGDYILFLSRIDKYTKGLDILMKAFAKIADRYRDLKLVLGGYQFDSFEEIVHMLPEGLRTRVRYVGFITSDEKIRLLSEAKLFVLPSRHEAHPISLLEAMACGKAVVVSEIPELRFVREQKIGITFRNADPVDLEKKLTTVLNDPELRQQLGKKARQFTTSYLWDNIAINFEMFLEEVLLSEKPNPL
jgi:glycosyltransferase involved in cell wall biosynthesis